MENAGQNRTHNPNHHHHKQQTTKQKLSTRANKRAHILSERRAHSSAYLKKLWRARVKKLVFVLLFRRGLVSVVAATVALMSGL